MFSLQIIMLIKKQKTKCNHTFIPQAHFVPNEILTCLKYMCNEIILFFGTFSKLSLIDTLYR